MKKQFVIACLLSLWLFLFAPPVAGQEVEAAPPTSGDAESIVVDEADIPPAQEVEINEDNYRQFMELKDPNLQRQVIPENVFKPGSGLQKLEKLPEESQKHLRNELREIIVQGDPWQPGDEQGDFPYTPSTAASNNPGLEKQELEAWGELVDSYNQREAQIYENAKLSRAARGSQDGNRNTPGEGAGADGDAGQAEEGRLGQQAGHENAVDQSGSAGTYSPGASNDPNATSTEGVSQNAMEFLKGLGKGGEARDAQQTAQNDGQDNGQAEGQVDGQDDGQAQDGQQTETVQKTAFVSLPAEDATANPAALAEESVEGASQNALEYLTGESAQTSGAVTDPIPSPAGTISIQDLLNAQGVGGSSGTIPAPPASDEKDPPDETKIDEDGSGQ